MMDLEGFVSVNDLFPRARMCVCVLVCVCVNMCMRLYCDPQLPPYLTCTQYKYSHAHIHMLTYTLDLLMLIP